MFNSAVLEEILEELKVTNKLLIRIADKVDPRPVRDEYHKVVDMTKSDPWDGVK